MPPRVDLRDAGEPRICRRERLDADSCDRDSGAEDEDIGRDGDEAGWRRHGDVGLIE